MFTYFVCFMALSVYTDIGKGLLQILVLLQQPLLHVLIPIFFR